MKRYVEVYWTPWVIDDAYGNVQSNNIVFQEPKPVLNEISKQRIGVPGYLKCPATVAFCSNSFLIKAPFDINVAIENKTLVTTDRYGQDFFNWQIDRKTQETHPDNPYLMATFPRYVFYSNESVIMETFDPILLHSSVSRNTRVVPGAFDISKWVRPIEYAFEVIDDTQQLQFKANDPLMCVRFRTVKNLPVKLVRVTCSNELVRVSKACYSTKKHRPKLSLKQLYELASSYITAWRSGR